MNATYKTSPWDRTEASRDCISTLVAERRPLPWQLDENTDHGDLETPYLLRREHSHKTHVSSLPVRSFSRTRRVHHDPDFFPFLLAVNPASPTPRDLLDQRGRHRADHSTDVSTAGSRGAQCARGRSPRITPAQNATLQRGSVERRYVNHQGLCSQWTCSRTTQRPAKLARL